MVLSDRARWLTAAPAPHPLRDARLGPSRVGMRPTPYETKPRKQLGRPSALRQADTPIRHWANARGRTVHQPSSTSAAKDPLLRRPKPKRSARAPCPRVGLTANARSRGWEEMQRRWLPLPAHDGPRRPLARRSLGLVRVS